MTRCPTPRTRRAVSSRPTQLWMTKSPPITFTYISRCDISMLKIILWQRAARKALSSWEIHKSSGLDSIPPIVLLTCAPNLPLVLKQGPYYAGVGRAG
ncbi:unnamed protein product [Pieris macdunnoughi]|uniref:Uncharacterized protein n=1 Tax=Pieris macdunnoughi TaxID=345717 RepID=A0A821TIY3_9NEOP|nr:unnamed protein product [Pieris macdunnoughi]